MSASSYEPLSIEQARAKPQRVSRAMRREAARCVLTRLVNGDQTVAPVDAILRLGAAWLCEQGLAPLAWATWHTALDLPIEVAADIHRAYYVAVGDAELHRFELDSVLRTLAAQSITPVIFKGAVLAHTVYADPACRPMSDLDLWLTGEEMSRAQAALEAIGYRYVSKPERPPMIMFIDMGEIQMHGPQGGAGLVELHWGVFAGEWLRRAACVDESAIRSRVMAMTVLGQPALALSPEDAVIQVAAHAAVNHQMSLAALRSLVDVASVVRHQPIDWTVIVDRARQWRVATAMWLVLKLARELTGLDEAAPAIAQLSPSSMRQWLIARFANADSLVDRRDLSASPLRFVYLLLLVDRGRDAAQLVYRALWPEREWLVARYGRVGVSIRLRHLLNAMRGRI